MVDPARVPQASVQVFLREPSTETPLDAGEAQERFDLLKQWKKIGLPRVVGDGKASGLAMVAQTSSRSVGPPLFARCSRRMSYLPKSFLLSLHGNAGFALRKRHGSRLIS
jgi:hypothetical protein